MDIPTIFLIVIVIILAALLVICSSSHDEVDKENKELRRQINYITIDATLEDGQIKKINIVEFFIWAIDRGYDIRHSHHNKKGVNKKDINKLLRKYYLTTLQ